jgi:hypothetical protein
MADKTILELDIYLDESGKFLETSNVPAERNHPDAQQDFPSQIAGFVVPRHDIKEEAKLIFNRCADAAYGPPKFHQTRKGTIRISNVPQNLKGTDLKKNYLFRFVKQLVHEFRGRPNWKPVRIANDEGVCFGNQIAAYTNVFAELVLRVLEQESLAHPKAKISIQIFCTTMMKDGHTPTRRHEYTSRLEEYFKFLAVRRGLALESTNWSLDRFVPNLGHDHPALRVADVLTNASLGNFRKFGVRPSGKRTDDAKAFISIFGDRNWTMTVRELFDRVTLLMDEYSFGMAIIAIAEALGIDDGPEGHDENFIERANLRFAEINEKLVRMGARGRDPQLATVLNWLDQIVGQQRLVQRGYRLAQWLLTKLAQPLRQQLDNLKEQETVDWFEYGLRRWALTAANHQGKLFEAESEAKAMRAIAPRLARQWERAPILFDGLISQAVHLTDAFDFDVVSTDMRLVTDSLDTQADLFSKYQPGEFPDPIKFDLRAKALGTLVQNEMLMGKGNWNEIRAFSDAAIKEFSDANDKARQYQYRCHLETLAGDYPAARRYLIWSIRKAETQEQDESHAAIGKLLNEETDEPKWQRDFTVSHWLRLGKTICLNPAPEQEKFLRAYDASDAFATYVERRSLPDFPIHNILRFLAVIEASRRQLGPTHKALELLHSLDSIGKNEFVMTMILCACQAEVAALVVDVDRRIARDLLDNENSQVQGLKQLFQRLHAANISVFPRIDALIRSWEQLIEEITDDQAPLSIRGKLLNIGSQVKF